MICLLCLTCSWAQVEPDRSHDELAEPDEQDFTNSLLRQIFDPTDIETADSVRLQNLGFSLEAIRSILHWQQSGQTKGGYKRFQKTLSEADQQLLGGTIRGSQAAPEIIFRQKLQYSGSLGGWRLLQKGRIQSIWGNLVFLAEQDPGEARLTDHVIFTLSSQRVPYLEKLVLGDFHLTWGSGLLLKQSGSRLGLTPTSLVKRTNLILMPHYSTREQNYFRGLAGQWQVQGFQGMVFVSNRRAWGRLDQGLFLEDSDGIHLPGKTYDRQNIVTAGMAAVLKFSKFRIYLASLSDLSGAIEGELGLSWQISQNQFLQIYTDGPALKNSRSIANWAYKTGTMQVTIQSRYFPDMDTGPNGSVISLLGSRALSEKSWSTRIQIRPWKPVLIRYALDTGTAVQLFRLSDTRRVLQHKAQGQLKYPGREWQLDWSRRRIGPSVPADIWVESTSYSTLTKWGFSLTEKLSAHLRYRLNLKLASDEHGRSGLIQQRILYWSPAWKGAVGFVRYAVPAAALRLSIYESSLAESFGFFTAFKDGQRWFLYLKNSSYDQTELELRISQTRDYGNLELSKQLEYSFQLSIVL